MLRWRMALLCRNATACSSCPNRSRTSARRRSRGERGLENHCRKDEAAYAVTTWTSSPTTSAPISRTMPGCCALLTERKRATSRTIVGRSPSSVPAFAPRRSTVRSATTWRCSPSSTPRRTVPRERRREISCRWTMRAARPRRGAASAQSVLHSATPRQIEQEAAACTMSPVSNNAKLTASASSSPAHFPASTAAGDCSAAS
mmetsp:Transcript_21106/g.66690  ORF Transcript_21106/g.66690 Transcript_21106/m.66690 type:complete len:202 (+) Transcript_21106:1721-2326(+)